jgi:hypothetical protein
MESEKKCLRIRKCDPDLTSFSNIVLHFVQCVCLLQHLDEPEPRIHDAHLFAHIKYSTPTGTFPSNSFMLNREFASMDRASVICEMVPIRNNEEDAICSSACLYHASSKEHNEIDHR